MMRRLKRQSPSRQQQEDKLVHHRRSPLERLDDPPPAPLPTLLKRVSRAIKRGLTQIELIVSGLHVPPRHRTEASAARGRWRRSRARCAR
jgi:hypothetical protein